MSQSSSLRVSEPSEGEALLGPRELQGLSKTRPHEAPAAYWALRWSDSRAPSRIAFEALLRRC